LIRFDHLLFAFFGHALAQNLMSDKNNIHAQRMPRMESIVAL